MKLSTAIRIGSMTTKQITGKATDGGNGRCALGAAIDATGAKVLFGDWVRQAADLFPLLDTPGYDLMHQIVNMNDRFNFTREHIASYVEQIEDALEHDGYLTTGVTESKPLELIAQEK